MWSSLNLLCLQELDPTNKALYSSVSVLRYFGCYVDGAKPIVCGGGSHATREPCAQSLTRLSPSQPHTLTLNCPVTRSARESLLAGVRACAATPALHTNTLSCGALGRLAPALAMGLPLSRLPWRDIAAAHTNLPEPVNRAPPSSLSLQWVFGFRSGDAHDNMHLLQTVRPPLPHRVGCTTLDWSGRRGSWSTTAHPWL